VESYTENSEFVQLYDRINGTIERNSGKQNLTRNKLRHITAKESFNSIVGYLTILYRPQILLFAVELYDRMIMFG